MSQGALIGIVVLMMMSSSSSLAILVMGGDDEKKTGPSSPGPSSPGPSSPGPSSPTPSPPTPSPPTPAPASVTPPALLATGVSTNGRCGPIHGNTRCPGKACCSQWGWCGGEKGTKSDWCSQTSMGHWGGEYDGID